MASPKEPTVLQGTIDTTSIFNNLTSEQQSFLKKKWEPSHSRRIRDPEVRVAERRDVINLYMEQFKGKAVWKGYPGVNGKIKIISDDAELAKKIFRIATGK